MTYCVRAKFSGSTMLSASCLSPAVQLTQVVSVSVPITITIPLLVPDFYG